MVRYVVSIPLWLYFIYLFCVASLVALAVMVGVAITGAIALFLYLGLWFTKPAHALALTVFAGMLALVVRFPYVGLPALFVLLIYLWSTRDTTSASTSVPKSDPSASNPPQLTVADKANQEGAEHDEGRALRERGLRELERNAVAHVTARRDEQRRKLADEGFEGYEHWKSKP